MKLLGSSPPEIVAESIVELRQALEEALKIAVLTGAGISRESGIPTFRGTDGLWRNYSPEQLATPEAFARDPRLVWEWYDWRRSVIQKAQPNAGHLALAKLEQRKYAFTLITQNVDGLHDRAGSKNVLKLHGDIWQVRCQGCGSVERNEGPAAIHYRTLPPRCPCGGLLRPGVVWFGESLPADLWEQALEASAQAQLFLVVGTSAVVYPAAGLAEVARQAGARLAVVNPEATPIDSLADWVLRGPSGELLPRLL